VIVAGSSVGLSFSPMIHWQTNMRSAYGSPIRFSRRALWSARGTNELQDAVNSVAAMQKTQIVPLTDELALAAAT
jgi:hypothetical protein